MDEAKVREHAQAHGQAMVDGDLRKAGGDLTPEVQAKAGDVMKDFPRKVETAEVVSIAGAGDDYVVQARYSGEGTEVVVESRWAERDGTPKIVEMKVV